MSKRKKLNLNEQDAEFFKTLGERFKKIRKQKGIPRETIVDSTGISHHAVICIERRPQDQPIGQVWLFSQVLGIDPLDMISGKIPTNTVQDKKDLTALPKTRVRGDWYTRKTDTVQFKQLAYYLHNSNLIEGFDSPEADAALNKGWEYLRFNNQKGNKLNARIIQQLHKFVVKHQEDYSRIWPGAFRDRSRIRVMIGGREGMAPHLVANAMEEWIANIDKHTPKENHIAFEKIHPFVDGNGRTGRLLMWYQEWLAKEQPTFISYEERAAYYDWFK